MVIYVGHGAAAIFASLHFTTRVANRTLAFLVGAHHCLTRRSFAQALEAQRESVVVSEDSGRDLRGPRAHHVAARVARLFTDVTMLAFRTAMNVVAAALSLHTSQ